MRAEGIENSEVFVVDNDSTDGGPDYVEENFPRVRLIRMLENTGFSRANNAAIRKSRGEYLIFLNPDTVIHQNSLTDLMAAASRPEVGAAGPLMIDEKGKYQVSFGGRRTFFREFLQKALLNPYWGRAAARRKTPKHVVWVSGACLCVRREVLDTAGYFDEKFFLYFEDIDLCYRIKKFDWEVVLTPDVRIFHAGGASTGAQPLMSRYHYRRSQLYFYRKHNGPISRWMLKAYLALTLVPLWIHGFTDPESREAARMFFLLLREKKEDGREHGRI